MVACAAAAGGGAGMEWNRILEQSREQQPSRSVGLEQPSKSKRRKEEEEEDRRNEEDAKKKTTGNG